MRCNKHIRVEAEVSSRGVFVSHQCVCKTIAPAANADTSVLNGLEMVPKDGLNVIGRRSQSYVIAGARAALTPFLTNVSVK